MPSAESSASEGEIVESPHKANTASSRQREFGIDKSSRGYGRDGMSGMNGYKKRDSTRSPSPYRHRRDRSPSPYRHRRTRSPSPYRHDRASHARESVDSQSNKRKASPSRYDRPEKRYFPGRGGNHNRGGQYAPDYRKGRQPRDYNEPDNVSDSKYRPVSYAENERFNPAPEPAKESSTLNGHQLAANNDEVPENGSTPVDPSSVPQDEPEYTLPVIEDKVATEESREQKRARWAAMRRQFPPQNNTSLLQHAVVTNASETTTPIASPARPSEKSVSPSSDSPRLPSMDSVPASPDVMVIDKEDGVGTGASPAAEESFGAANYDPTQDMEDDRVRAEQKAQQPGMSAAAYDETDPKQLSTLPGEKVQQAKKKKKKKDLDMFAFSDEEDEGDEEEEEGEDDDEEPTPAKGKVLDAKLLDNWDDPEGYYKIISNELVNGGRYRMVKSLGRGVYANVAEAEDVKDNSGQLVAIKIVRKNDAMRKSSQKEMDFVRKLNEQDPQDKRHIIRLLGSFDHKGHLCIVFEHMLKNLRDLLKTDTSGHGLSLQAVKTYARQMFSGLKHLQDCQIIHADLKPDNILVSADRKTVKICDLGTAADKRDNNEPTPYLASRFYRAPEIILGMEIGYAIDMWSIGCTIFELWTGKILFPGRTNNQMIRVFMDTLGWPTEKLLRKASLKAEHFELGPPLRFLSGELDTFGNKITRKIEQQRTPSKPLKSRVQEAGQNITGNGPSPAEVNDLADLIEKCLNWNWEKRIQPKEAVNHKLFVRPAAMAPRAAVVKPAIARRPFPGRR